jgi:chromosome partitioning protein
MEVWAFVSQKGGAGKSTLATQVGVCLTQAGHRTIIVDLDPQASAYGWSLLRQGRPPEAVRSLPLRLSKMVEAAADLGHTHMLVDTAPHSDAAALEAIKAAHMIVCPTKSTPFEIMAMKDTVGLLDLCDRRNRAIGVVNGVLPNKGKAQTDEYDTASENLKKLGLRTLTSYVCLYKDFTDAIGKGGGVTELMPKGKAAGQINALTGELLTWADALGSNVINLKARV